MTNWTEQRGTDGKRKICARSHPKIATIKRAISSLISRRCMIEWRKRWSAGTDATDRGGPKQVCSVPHCGQALGEIQDFRQRWPRAAKRMANRGQGDKDDRRKH